MGVYKWGNGSRFKGDAQEIGAWIEGLDKKTPEEIVNSAEDEKCPAHKCFTWEDYEAAHKWRLQEARMLVNAIVFEEEVEDFSLSRPAFESAIINDERQYVNTTIESLSDDEIWNQIAGETIQTIKTLQDKLSIYSQMRKGKADKAQMHLELAKEAMAQ